MITKDIKTEIKEFFFVNPNCQLRVREIERKLKLSLPSIIRYCHELEDENILTTVIIGKTKFYTASRSQIYLLEKKLFNIKKIYESGLIDYIKKEISNPGIIIFGSYAKGEDVETSDIDLYIETPSKIQIDVKDFEKILHQNIEIFKELNNSR